MNTDELYRLLPEYYRSLDVTEGGYALRDLLAVMTTSFAAVEKDIEQMGEDWFIETCAPWVVPYLGQLVGWEAVPGQETSRPNSALAPWLARRSEVANTLRNRSRKGTLPLLEDLARDVAGWPALAVESAFQAWLLGTTADLHRHREGQGAPGPELPQQADFHAQRYLQLSGAPLDQLARMGDAYQGAPGLSPCSVALHVWRVQSFPVTHSLAGDNPPPQDSYRFSALGNDAQLFTPSGGQGVPRPLLWHDIAVPFKGTYGDPAIRVSKEFYGPGKAFSIYALDWPCSNPPLQPHGLSEAEVWEQATLVPRERVVPADLSSWAFAKNVPEGFVAVDPALGRIAFKESDGPEPDTVFVSWHTGFSAPIGGGEYQRPMARMEQAKIYRLGPGQSLKDGLALWQKDRRTGPDRVCDAIIEFECSGLYEGFARIVLKSDETLQVRAAQGVRPILQIENGSKGASLIVTQEPGSLLVLDGLILSEGKLVLSHAGAPPPHDCAASVVIRHCTLVPGWNFDRDPRCALIDHVGCNCRLAHYDKDSIRLTNYLGTLTIQHSIVGSIAASARKDNTDPVTIHISDSIIDSADPGQMAVYDDTESTAHPGSGPWAHVELTVQRCTVFGMVSVHSILLGENSIFRDGICVGRRRPGCLRYCWLPDDTARAPERYECQPEKAITAAGNITADPPPPETPEEARCRVRPHFVSDRFGDHTYAQLALHTATEIRRGADDRSEMGVFHDLYHSRREANLQSRLAEFTPALCHASVVFET